MEPSIKHSDVQHRGAIEKYFEFDRHNTNYRTEFLGGFTTFLAMAYILFVNTAILSDAGMDSGAVFVATGVAAAIGCLMMGIWAKYPIALAPGMGLNAFFAYTVVLGMGIPWQTALAGVFVSGVIFFILAITRLREKIIDAIPPHLKYATGAGIGLFIAFIGLQNAGVIIYNEPTLVSLGDLTVPATALAVFGFIITAILLVRGFKGGIFYGMVLTALIGIIFGLIELPSQVVSAIPSVAPTFGVALAHLSDIVTVQLFVVVFTFLFVDFFDTAGTIIAVANQAGFLRDNKLPNAHKALAADSVATITGSILGTSTTTSYIESTAGVATGARTGFASVVTAGCFLLFLFFSPLLDVVTPSVTAPALIMVGVLMAASLSQIEWNKLDYAIPAFVTVIAMPLSYSIATGIALGFITYPILKMVKGEYKDIHPIMYGLFIVFVIYFTWLT